MTKTVEVSRGMARKLERHMPLRFRLLGKCFVVTGAILLAILTLLWSQYLFPTMLDAHVAFDAVLNEYDEFMNDWTFEDFEHREQDPATDLFVIYLWHVTNTENFIEGGYKPRLQEMGPYAYVRQAYKYDIEWPDDSHHVTYKEWWFLSPVESPEACRLMFFQQGLGEYNEHTRDHPAACAPDHEEVTILNPKYMSLQNRWTTEGIFGELSQSVFANIRESMVAEDAFPRTVKAELLPEAFSDVWAYRLAVHASSALNVVVSALTDSDAAFHFAASDSSATALMLDKLSVSWLMGNAAYGTADAIELASTTIAGADASRAMLSAAEAAYLLAPANPISVLNYDRGVPLWIGAARHLGLIVSSVVEEDAAAANQIAHAYLLSELSTAFGKGHVETEALVLGIATYLYGEVGWMASPSADNYRAREWGGQASFVRGGGCDCGTYSTGLYADVAVETVPGFYFYTCAWGLASSLGFYAPWEAMGTAPPLNDTLTRWIIDPNYEDTRSELGIYIDENLVRWWQAYEYCNVSKGGRSPTCDAMSEANQMTEVELPAAMLSLSQHTMTSFSASANTLAAVDSHQKITGSAEFATMRQYRGQVCAVAGHLYDKWSLQDHWHEVYVAASVARATGLEFVAGRLHDLGYAQWGGGYVTLALWGVPSVLNIERKGYWKFGMASYTTDFMEFHSQAMAIGYSNMNLTTADAQILLDALAGKGTEARIFRGSIGKVATSYRCDGSDGGNIRFQERPSGVDDIPAELDETCEPYSIYCDCQPGGSYFVTQNTFGNFSSIVPRKVLDPGSQVLEANFKAATALLSEVFMSSDLTCQRIQDHYKECSWLETEPGYSYWLVNCKRWETLISDPTFGIYCDLVTILKIDSAYDHDYQSATIHPYPRQRGNVIAFWLQEWSTYRVLIERRTVCNDPSDCDYASGGMFVTQSVRRLLFEGYVDRVAMRLLNSELEPYNLTARCVNRSTLELDEYCRPVENIECSEDGFEVSDVSGNLARFQRDGQRREEWYAPKIILNLSDISSTVGPLNVANVSASNTLAIDNPAFAIYPGKLWVPNASSYRLRRGEGDTRSLKFHKKADCDFRFLGGAKKWGSCTTRLQTGKGNLNDVQRVAEWRGNGTLITGDDFVDTINTSAGTLIHQTRPFGWEGFRAYNFTYLLRGKGFDFQGADVMYVLNADHLMLIELMRLRTGDLKIGMADLSEEYYVEWPTRKKAEAHNYTRRFWARANRYETTSTTFDEGRRFARDKLKDLHDERYTIPYGMISLQAITDTPCFISLPHFYGNEEWGGLEARQVYFDTNYDRRLHSYYVDIEPITGQTVREARRFQFNFRVERNMQFPQIISSQERCEVPTADFSENGYGCFMFFPVWWVSEERHIDGVKALRLKREVLEVTERLFYTALYGAAVGFMLIFLGIGPWCWTNRREVAFRQRIYID